MNKLAIYGSRRQNAVFPAIDTLLRSLSTEGLQVVMHPKLAGALEEAGIYPKGCKVTTHLPEDCHLVLGIGGDGTFLRAARWVGSREIPVLGVNTGHLGFLSACRIDEAPRMVSEFFSGGLTVERRMMLEVKCASLPENIWPYALNEVSVMKEDTSSMVSVHTEINGAFLADYRCDGLIASTPTGSTAYSLSAGGPILEPSLSNILIVPVAPHTLTVRPLVAGGDAVFTFKVDCRADSFRLSIDSCSFRIDTGETVEVHKAPFSTMIVRRPGTNFADVLREKLLWNTSTL